MTHRLKRYCRPDETTGPGATTGMVRRPDAHSDEGLTLSYLGVRRGVGFLSLTLPVVLVVGKLLLDGGGIQDSISAYYYTGMRDYFVGSNCAVGVFLLCHRYQRTDNYLSTAAALFVVGLSLLPTTEPGTSHTSTQSAVGTVHFLCATLYFLLQAVFAFFLFTRTDPHLPPTRQKRRRNVLYRVCGIVIVVCLGLIGATNLVLSEQVRHQLHSLFWLESIATWAIAAAWLVKGGLFLTDGPGSEGLAVGAT